MVKKKLSGNKENDPDWIAEIADGLLNINLNELSDNQIKILRNQYLDYVRDGLKPKDAIEKAVQIIKCFNG
ncbi:hypothetical protein AYK21_05185 [Thermoplasmatales archaeon SG8-52-2]|nr:MAG: hypothetical protein AYK21_05185 [Thermoplasmatales archaeon SG8-52-2]